jgi:hypothetical protein
MGQQLTATAVGRENAGQLAYRGAIVRDALKHATALAA